ncbi:outer membrane lipoprotein carrier protein LolA [Lysinibacillus sp. KU-BSD001]|uniref:LolA family protein n=1 Tax=Lysinibacillus sp. KU-BSD001 TaxID=3141328 RepID=UPI0036E11D39
MKKIMYSAALILSLSLAACSDAENYSPQEIIDQVMQETTEVSSFYGEYVMDIGDGQPSTIKQWEKDGKRRIEVSDESGAKVITVNDGKTLTSYDEQSKSAFVYHLTAEGTEPLMQPSPKEQAHMLLKMVENTHEISVGEEEKVAGRDTYHLIAKAKEENGLMGDLEVWVDKKTWMTLKSVSRNGDMVLTIEYTMFDVDQKIEDSLFALDLPADVTVETEEMISPEQVTIEEAKAALGEFLVMKEQNGITLESVTDMKVEERPEFVLNYSLDGEPVFALSVFVPTESYTEIGPKTGETIEVRGQQVEKIDLNAFRYVQWTENNYQYGIILENPDVTFEEIYEYIEQMEMVQ